VLPEPLPVDSLELRASHELLWVPPERAAPPAPAAAPRPPAAAAPTQTQVPATPRSAPMSAQAAPALPGPDARPPVQIQVQPNAMTWVMGGVAVLAGVGWAMERRRRRALEVDKDSVFWANAHQSNSSIITTAGGLTDILPDSPDPAEAARAIYVTAIGET